MKPVVIRQKPGLRLRPPETEIYQVTFLHLFNSYRGCNFRRPVVAIFLLQNEHFDHKCDQALYIFLLYLIIKYHFSMKSFLTELPQLVLSDSAAEEMSQHCKESVHTLCNFVLASHLGTGPS